RELEEGIGERRDLLADQRPVDALGLRGLRDVDRGNRSVRVGRADEVDVAHAVPANVVEEDALALDEPLVLLARDALADPDLSGSDDDGLGDGRGDGRGLGHRAAALIASTMFT